MFSGQNQLYDDGPPPDSATVVVAVGLSEPARQFRSCTVAATLDNRVGVVNEEQGRTISVCTGPREPWARLWPTFQHDG